MKALKPYIKDINEKYKDNENLKNKAVGKLYEDADQNPLAGCGVSLVQLPVFLGLYRGIRLLALDGQLQEPFLWIPNLQGPVSPPAYRGLDWLTQGWEPAHGVGGLGPIDYIPPLGWETTLAFLVMPVVLVVGQSITMSILQPPLDENATEEERETMEKSQGFLKFLPLMIGFFSLQVPAGLTIYWFTSNLFTLSQSLGVRAYFAANPPQIELPDYWEDLATDKKFDDMTPDERRQASAAGLNVGPTFADLVTEARYLHTHIERQPIRQDSPSWQAYTASAGTGSSSSSSSSSSIPAEMEDWVNEKSPATSSA